MTDPLPNTTPTQSFQSESPSAANAGGDFHPGVILAGRYRVVALLGKGGMGLVYRADDLTLAQSVALKFLPAHLAGDPAWLSQFLNEVRVARQVTHPNVCRVHDIGEAAGWPFLSMEYVDGEDLASLLKRIGRLPEDKATELAHQLCRGLAAAHERGVLHRDLKPANVMIDGRGRVRITDFGLAWQSSSTPDINASAGTPAYQAPEQLSGHSVTVRSDLYALGLVLYEMFTGRRPFAASSHQELLRQRELGAPTPSSHLDNLDPVVERVILRCLEHDPHRRPRSANEVAAALPGGDPLAAALAAGETPSPSMVAHAGGDGTLSTRVGLTALVLALAALFAGAWLNGQATMFGQFPHRRSPTELANRAQDFIAAMGYPEAPRDRAWGIASDEDLLNFLRSNDSTNAQKMKETGHPPLLYFWYRQGPASLTQRQSPADTTGWSMPGRVLPREPPLREPGMSCVFLSLEGDLLEFHAIPPLATPALPDAKTDWTPLLKLAGLVEGSDVKPVSDFRRRPPVYADARAAWVGNHPAQPDLAIRVEAASLAGRPVYFHVAPAKSPPDVPDRLAVEFLPRSLRQRFEEWKNEILGFLALPVGAWFAWKNWRLGRANRRGATLLAAGFVALGMTGWLFAAHHVPNPAMEVAMFAGMLGRVAMDGLLLWLAYMALEPWVRRRSPWRVISWNRLLEGRVRDSLVGQDLLFGVLAGALYAAIAHLLTLAPLAMGRSPEFRFIWDAAFTEGIGALLLSVQVAVLVALRHFFLFFLLLLVVRRVDLAAISLLLFMALPWLLDDGVPWIQALTGLIYGILGLLTLLRWGLLSFMVFHIAEEVLMYLPVSADLSAWYALLSVLSLAGLAAFAIHGYWASRPGISHSEFRSC